MKFRHIAGNMKKNYMWIPQKLPHCDVVGELLEDILSYNILAVRAGQILDST
jgi:hypothetical protein